MPREVDSIAFKNDKKELIASFNVFFKKLYWAKNTTEEEKADVLAQLEKKKYKNFTIWGVEPPKEAEKDTKSLVEEELKKTEEEIKKFEAEIAAKEEKEKKTTPKGTRKNKKEGGQ